MDSGDQAVSQRSSFPHSVIQETAKVYRKSDTLSGSHMPIKPSFIFLSYGKESLPFWKTGSINGLKTDKACTA